MHELTVTASAVSNTTTLGSTVFLDRGECWHGFLIEHQKIYFNGVRVGIGFPCRHG